jgi:hypothetical protein
MVCHAAYPLRLRHTPADNAERAAIDSSALRVRFECSTGPDTFQLPRVFRDMKPATLHRIR